MGIAFFSHEELNGSAMIRRGISREFRKGEPASVSAAIITDHYRVDGGSEVSGDATLAHCCKDIDRRLSAKHDIAEGIVLFTPILSERLD